MPQVGSSDQFEDAYIAKLRLELSRLGQFIKYEKDVASLDLGLHLYGELTESGNRELSGIRIWMQAKGLQSTTVPADLVQREGGVKITGLKVDHVQFWYASAEPVYLVVYVESIDTFLIEDVRTLVQQQYDIATLNQLQDKQKTVSLRISTECTLARAESRLQLHRSMRIDTKAFRGRPLGHGFDPLRSEFERPDAAIFANIVNDLLDAHEFKAEESVDVSDVFDDCPENTTITRGTLTLTYEWTAPLFTEYGYDEGSTFRIESAPFHAQGEVVVIVAPGDDQPRLRSDLPETLARWSDLGVDKVLIFYNGSDIKARLFGGWRVPFGGMCTVPQGIGSITFNVLTTTNVYLKYADKLAFAHHHFL